MLLLRLLMPLLVLSRDVIQKAALRRKPSFRP